VYGRPPSFWEDSHSAIHISHSDLLCALGATLRRTQFRILTRSMSSQSGAWSRDLSKASTRPQIAAEPAQDREALQGNPALTNSELGCNFHMKMSGWLTGRSTAKRSPSSRFPPEHRSYCNNADPERSLRRAAALDLSYLPCCRAHPDDTPQAATWFHRGLNKGP